MQNQGKRDSEKRVLADKYGHENVMVWLEKFYLDEVIGGASHRPHPAFVVDGREVDGIWISKYQNTVENGVACSVPNVDPATGVDFDAAADACRAMGRGFHLMTALPCATSRGSEESFSCSSI